MLESAGGDVVLPSRGGGLIARDMQWSGVLRRQAGSLGCWPDAEQIDAFLRQRAPKLRSVSRFVVGNSGSIQIARVHPGQATQVSVQEQAIFPRRNDDLAVLELVPMGQVPSGERRGESPRASRSR